MDTKEAVTHTPGPWKVDGAMSPQGSLAVGHKDGWHIATAINMGDGGGKDATIANARLIAASPDMLGTLQYVKRELLAVKRDALDSILVSAIEAAILRATGGK
jgi:hypothetical protein